MKFALVLSLVVMSCLPANGADLPDPIEDKDFLWDGTPSLDLVNLGRDLFFDPILSGNRNIACGTCHDPALGTGDGVALSIGEGGFGFGPERTTGDAITGRVPRNAQPLYNIGARAYVSMFHDGRLEIDRWGGYPSRFKSPAKEQLPEGLNNLLTAQAMFPVLSEVEMAGQAGENEVADAVAAKDMKLAWNILAMRLAEIPEYSKRFINVFSDVQTPSDIRFDHAAQALAAFQTVSFRSDKSRFDARLAGWPMAAKEEAGLNLFYGKARCSSCHSGALLTDHAFHAIAVPQFGPGKGHGLDNSFANHTGFSHRVEDEGRYAVSGDEIDLFKFRTPSLRNVELTGPWGHDGAFDSLETMVRHHLNTVQSLANYTPPKLPSLDAVIQPVRTRGGPVYRTLTPAKRIAFDLKDNWVMSSKHLRSRIARANELAPIDLSNEEVANLLAFLNTLTDPTAVNRTALVPLAVPSNLPPQPIRRP